VNALFLSGESLYNKEWMEQIQKSLHPLFDKTVLYNYRHWEQGGPIDLGFELPQVIEQIKQLDLEPYTIFAKSAGTVLSMQGIARGALDPAYCIFVGVPLPLAKRSDDAILNWSHNYHKPTLFIQNDHDPLTSAQELADYLKKCAIKNYRLETLPGDSHNYPDMNKIRQLVAGFIA
jgi:hypothetical protein